MESWHISLFMVVGLGVVFFVVSLTALYWAAKNGQLKNFDKNARTIFTDEEPEGFRQDAFPKSRKERKAAIRPAETGRDS